MDLLKSKSESKINTPSFATQFMKAGMITAPKEFEVVETPILQPAEGEVRIQLSGSGICASNLPVWEGRKWFSYPASVGAPGHEGWGVIDAVGKNVRKELIGKRVTALTYNAFAEYDLAKVENIVILPDSLAKKAFPGEPFGCAMNIFQRTNPLPKDKVAVIGCGFLGLLLIQLLKDRGCEVLAISQRDFSLEMAREMQADHCVKLDDHYRVIEKIKALTKGEFCDKTLECTGKEWPLNLGIEITRTKGKLIVAGYHQDGMRKVNMQLLNWRGIDMINAHERDPREYIKGIKNAILAIEEKRLHPFELLTHRFSLQNLARGFHYLKERPEGFIKGIAVYENDE